jgi:general secretion pathway protein D
MKTNSTVHRFLAALLTVCLTMPLTAVTALADGKSGKKSFQQGVKYEQTQQWDLAAQEFALAVAADPNNAEYRLHYARALQNASIMFMKRGDELAKQGDYASAYNAYRQALGLDPGNEMAGQKMRAMLELQKDQAQNLNQYKLDERSGRLKPTSNEVTIARKPRNRDALTDITFKDTDFKECVKNLARQLDLNVLFDESVRVPGKVSFELRGVTLAKAFDLVLLQNKMTFEQVDHKTILIFADNPQTKGKFEKAAVKSFYLGNLKTAEARTLISTLLPGRQVAVLEEQKALILKGTQSELQLVQDIIESVDKNISEVVIDVEIYEVSHDTKLQIGNQVVTDKPFEQTEYIPGTGGQAGSTRVTGQSATLANLGGYGRSAFSIVGNTLTGGTGLLLGLPPTTLSLLQTRGNSRLLNKIQVHALDGQQNQTKVGKSVPVSLGQNYGLGGSTGFGTGLGTGGGVGGVGGVNNPTLGGVNNGLGYSGYGGGLFNNIQYKDVGLVIDATPKITNEGYVELKMKIETSNVEAGADALTPNFTQRSLSTTARIQDGVTSIVASVSQDTRGDSRGGIPVLSMLPLVGRLFTTPNQTTNKSDIVITVTPHIIRATEVTKDDNLAKLAGVLQNAGGTGSGLPASIEDVLMRVQFEEEAERRLIAARSGLPVEQSTTGNAVMEAPAAMTPVAAPNSATPLRNVGNPGGTFPDNGLPAGPSGAALQPGGNSEAKPPRKSIVIEGNPNRSSSDQNLNSAPVTADTNTQVPPVEPNPVVPDPSLINNTQGNPTLPNGGLPNGATPNGVTPIPGLPNGMQPNPAQPNPAQPTGGPGGQVLPEGTQGARLPEGGDAGAQTPQDNGVRPAVVVGASRPPHVERYIQEQRLKAMKERQAMANGATPQPSALPVEYVPAMPRVNAPPATIKTATGSAADPNAFTGAPAPLRIEAPKAGTVALSLSPAQPRLALNKTVQVNLQVDAQSLLSSANLVLHFDSKKLQVKSVRGGDLLGRQPDIMHSVENGVLTISVNAAGGKAGKASGRLLVIEFVAVGEGAAEISVSNSESQIKLPGNALATLSATPTQLTIGR